MPFRRYDNGQTLPDFAFAPEYQRMRRFLGAKIHQPSREESDEKAKPAIKVTARRGPAHPPKPAERSRPATPAPQNWSWKILEGDHDYATQKNLICPAEWNCSEDMVRNVYAKQRNGIPGHAGNAQIESGESYIVPYGLLGRWLNPYLPEAIQFGGRIKSYVGKDGLTVNNVTVPNRHIFDDGWANRNATRDKDGNWYSQTHGKGRNYFGGGLMSAVNTFMGPGAFDDLDNSIRNQLYQETHPRKH